MVIQRFLCLFPVAFDETPVFCVALWHQMGLIHFSFIILRNSCFRILASYENHAYFQFYPLYRGHMFFLSPRRSVFLDFKKLFKVIDSSCRRHTNNFCFFFVPTC